MNHAMFNAGELCHRITVLSPIGDATDREGRAAQQYVTVFTAMAAIRDVSGREFYEAASHQLENIVTITLRWRNGLRNDMRLIYGGTTYEIVQINHYGYRRQWVQLKARIVQAERSEASAHGYL
ncbi:MAG: phage head closure protein [Clostridia bacterium]